MKLLYLALSFLTLFLFNFYLATNISGIGKGSLNLQALGMFVVLGGMLFFWRAGTAQSIVIFRSLIFLLLFLAYFIFRIGFDIGSMDSLKAYTVDTTGGVILFYILGNLVAIIIGQHQKNAFQVKNYFKYFSFFFIAYLIANYGLLLSILVELIPRLREDIFFVSGINGAYQRPGSFLVISYLMLITSYAQFISLKQRNKPSFWIRLSSVLTFALLIIYTLTSLFIAQMIGSNNATVLIAGLSLIVIANLMLLYFKFVRYYLTTKPLTFTRLVFGKISSRLIILGVVVFAILIGVILAIASYLGIDLTKIRLIDFGSGEISSVNSRLDLLNNFIIHFTYSPFFGNMNVDCITTGCGTYVHSVFAFLLTHTGILGFFLFTLYLILAYKERFKMNPPYRLFSLLTTNIYNLNTVLFFTAILLTGILATTIIWATLWFAMGLFLTGLGFKIDYE